MYTILLQPAQLHFSKLRRLLAAHVNRNDDGVSAMGPSRSHAGHQSRCPFCPRALPCHAEDSLARRLSARISWRDGRHDALCAECYNRSTGAALVIRGLVTGRADQARHANRPAIIIRVAGIVREMSPGGQRGD